MSPDPHTEFTKLTNSRYKAMWERFYYELPFDLNQYREFVLNLLGSEQGLTRCEYCNRPLDLLHLELDHRQPPVQGGVLDLDNLAACCRDCNQQKGKMNSAAFTTLLRLVNNELPGVPKFTEIDRTAVLGRLQSQLRLAYRVNAKTPKVKITPHRRPA